jgi:hypothetical protein
MPMLVGDDEDRMQQEEGEDIAAAVEKGCIGEGVKVLLLKGLEYVQGTEQARADCEGRLVQMAEREAENGRRSLHRRVDLGMAHAGRLRRGAAGRARAAATRPSTAASS